jgi:hypothetical protein
MVYPALLPPMRTPQLPVVDWTDALANLNGLVRFSERRNLVSACVPSHFNWPVPYLSLRSTLQFFKAKGCLKIGKDLFLSYLSIVIQSLSLTDSIVKWITNKYVTNSVGRMGETASYPFGLEYCCRCRDGCCFQYSIEPNNSMEVRRWYVYRLTQLGDVYINFIFFIFFFKSYSSDMFRPISGPSSGICFIIQLYIFFNTTTYGYSSIKMYSCIMKHMPDDDQEMGRNMLLE